MHRELGTWKATGLAVLYQCVIAYAVASIVYVIGSFIGGTDPVASGVAVAILSLAAIGYLLFAKDPFFQNREAPEMTEVAEE